MIRLPVILPRAYQIRAWNAFQRGIRFHVKTWPRRSGKDLVDFSMLVSMAIKRAGNYYYLFPTRAWAERALWENMPEWTKGKKLVDVLCPEGIVAKKNNSDYYIELKNGSRIKIDGTDNLNFVGQGGNGYVASEFQSHRDEVTGFLAPILREGKATVLFNGTLRGKNNQLWARYDDNKERAGWFAEWLTLRDTKTDYWISEGDGICVNPELVGKISPYTGMPFTNIQDDVDSGLISLALAKQEYLNEAVSQVYGSYYSREIEVMEGEGRLTWVSWDGMSPVYTFWDLGGDKQTNDKTAILFCTMDKATKKVQIIDYYENTGRLRGHYFDVLKIKNYRYGGHYVPHDGKRSNTWTGEGMAETARREHGVELRYIPIAKSILNEIEIVRRDFVNYTMNPERCSLLFEHLTKYHEAESTGAPCHKNNCSICRGASHGADTLRLMAMARNLGLVEDYLSREYSIWRSEQPTSVIDDWIVV